MSVIASPSPRLELALLRKSVGALAARRHSCVHCHRTPLIGELVFYYGERMVCELCRPLRRERPSHEEIVHSPEHALTVRRL
jgi:hypothetical protein